MFYVFNPIRTDVRLLYKSVTINERLLKTIVVDLHRNQTKEVHVQTICETFNDIHFLANLHIIKFKVRQRTNRKAFRYKDNIAGLSV